MSEEKKSGSWQDTVSDWLISIIVAVVLAFGIRTFLVEPYMVSGPSMMNTLQDQERLLVNKLVYYTRQPKRGEIIVFKYPSDTRRDFIKRVIAVGGDTIEIRDGKTYVNGEAWMKAISGNPSTPTCPRPPSCRPYLCYGGQPEQLRRQPVPGCGFVDLSLVKGKASLIFWPLGQVRRCREKRGCEK